VNSPVIKVRHRARVIIFHASIVIHCHPLQRRCTLLSAIRDISLRNMLRAEYVCMVAAGQHNVIIQCPRFH